MFPELSLVVSTLKQPDGTAQSLWRTCKAAATSCQSGEIVAQIGIRALDGVGLALAGRNLMRVATWVDQIAIGRAVIGEVAHRFVALRSVLKSVLQHLLALFPGERQAHSERENAAGKAIYDRGEEEEVPLFRCMAYSSSISTVSLLFG
jgi:hypothetical protein